MTSAIHAFRGLSYILFPVIVLSGAVCIISLTWLPYAIRFPKGERFGKPAWDYAMATEEWMYLKHWGPASRFACYCMLPSLKWFALSSGLSALFFFVAFVLNGCVNPSPL